jgi:hypothetical protein
MYELILVYVYIVHVFITIHKTLPLVPILGQNNPAQAFENHSVKNPYKIILFNTQINSPEIPISQHDMH